MFRNLFFFSFGALGGLWFVWPGILTNQGWDCTKDIVFNANKKPRDPQSLVENFERKLKVSSAVSPKTLLKVENLGPIDKLKIVGDACFR